MRREGLVGGAKEAGGGVAGGNPGRRVCAEHSGGWQLLWGEVGLEGRLQRAML